MERRRFLASVGAISAGPVLWYAARPPRRAIELRYWLSKGASTYEIRDRIEEYLRTALSPVFDPIDLSFGGTVAVPTEHGYEVTRSGRWPRKVLGGSAFPDGVDGVDDVNLLVTDGSLRQAPTGVAVHNIASIGGARYIEEAPARDALPTAAPYTTQLLALHVLLHEVGHALGLKHEHGELRSIEGGTAASPMVSTYPWIGETDQFNLDGGICGGDFPDPGGGRRYLSFEYSECAQEELRNYRGGFRR